MRLREEHSLDRMLTNARDGAFVIASDGRIVLWNRAAERILGYAAREALGRPCCELFARRDQDGHRLFERGCGMMTFIKTEEPVRNFDLETRTKAGRPVWLNVSTVATPNGASGPVTVHLFRDVTRLKELLQLVSKRAPVAPPAASASNGLTRREIEVLRSVAAGGSTKDTAKCLRVSPATVRNHVQNILAKLGVHSRLQAVAYATTHRLL